MKGPTTFRLVAGSGLILTLLVIGRDAVAATLPPFSRVTMPNGMTLLLMEQHEVPLISLSLIVKSGSTSDPAGREGLASLTVDLLRKGTTASAIEVSEELDHLGATLRSAVNHDFATLEMEFLSKDAATSLNLLADCLQRPSFPADEVRKGIDLRAEENKSLKDRAGQAVRHYFEALLFGRGSAYGRPVDGDENSVASIRRADVAEFHKRHVVPRNTILAIVGDFQMDAMTRLAESAFAAWQGPDAPHVSIDTAAVAEPGLLLVDKPDSTQSYFNLGTSGISRTNPDRVAVSVVNTLLGGRFTSWLNTELRIRTGLSYGANSVFEQRLKPGPFYVSSFTKTENTAKAIDLVLTTIERLHRDGISAEELESTKTYLKGQFPPTIETSSRLATTLVRLEFYGLDASDVSEYESRVDAVTAEDARRVIRQYFPTSKLAIAIVGQASQLKEILKKYAAVVQVRSISDPGY